MYPGNKVGFSTSLNPVNAFPLDARYYFSSYTAAESAAQGATQIQDSSETSQAGSYFIGETIVVVQNGKASLYVIQPDKSLSPAGVPRVESTDAGKILAVNSSGEWQAMTIEQWAGGSF